MIVEAQMLIPKTRTEAIELYSKRLRGRHKKLKYDMYLGGLICCSPTEFEEHVLEKDEIRCHLCCQCYVEEGCMCFDDCCDRAAHITLSKSWNEYLYSN